MTATQNIQIEDYKYELPDERIAKYPLQQRDCSKLLHYDSAGRIQTYDFRHLPALLPQHALMIFNNTKVIYARLHFQKSTGANIEIFCLEPHCPADYQQSFSQTAVCSWICMVGNLKKWKDGALKKTVQVSGRTLTLCATRGETSGTGHIITFEWGDDTIAFSEILDAIGELPIPPYLNRDTEQSDLSTYQTVYSKIKGSVAAPTAGLHFTPDVLAAVDAAGVQRKEITLHVGAGTFRPVKSESIGDHTMHAEWISVSREVIMSLIEHQCSCVAVGTTSVRTLESLYYIGVLAHENPNASSEDLSVPQWMPYEYAATEGPKLAPHEALQSLIHYMDRRGLDTICTTTRIIIAPGYHFHFVRHIVTNFHQPGSTLLLLVSAFVRGDWRNIYDYALAHDFRFLSYGDSSLLDTPTEVLPVTDMSGNPLSTALRNECHARTFLLHPVVHLHIFNRNGDLFLQKRPDWKTIQPGKWDTAVGGHIAAGETVQQALERESMEEMGFSAKGATLLRTYVHTSDVEREFVYVYSVVTDVLPCPTEEVSEGRFFSSDEIRRRLGTGFFTPNFEKEWMETFGDLVDK